MARGGGRAGFTLVETLVAIAILSGVLVASYAALSGALATAARLGARDAAVDLVARQFAELRTLPAGRMRDTWGDTPVYRWRLSVTAMPGHGALVTPYRVLGVIIARFGAGHAEVVLDTVILGPST